MGWIVYSKDGQTEKCVLHKLEYSGTFMGDRTVIATFSSEKKIDFSVFDYITYRGERFELELLPTVKKVSSYEYKYELRFVSLKYELERCMMRNIVPGDNGIVYPTPLSVEFTGDVKYLAERIQACLDAMYGKGAWSITIAESTESEEKNISMSNQNCWDALSLVNTEYKLNYFIKGRNVIIGGEEPVVDNVFEYGKGKGLYEIERISDTDTGVVTKLRAYGGTRNLDYSYPKLPDWEDSVLPANYALSPLRLMLPSFKADGKTDYVLASEEAIAKYGIREGTITYDDIYPSITGMKNSSGQAIDEIKSVSAITNETQPTFTVGLYDLGFDLNESLTTDEAQMSMKSGSLQGYTFNITKIERASDGSYTLTLGRNTLEKEDTGNFTVPNKDWNMKAGDKFVLLNILMPQAYIRDAENRLLARAKEYLAKYSSTNYSYNVGVDEIFMARNVNFYNDIMEGKRLTVNDQEIGINNENIIIQSLTIKEGEGIVPTFEVTLNNETTASTLDRIQGQISEVETSVSNNFSSQSELLKQYRKKLDKSVWDSIFVIHKDDSENPEKITSVQSLVGLWTNEFLSAKGLNPGSGGGSGEGGATALYQLNDVAKNASETGVLGAGPGKVLTYGTDGKWYAADAVGLDETALGKYLTDNNYAQKSDIPSLSGYATQSWVLGKNYITSDALSGYATQSWVNSQGYATASSLKAVSDKLNDFLEGSDTDGIINKWKELEAFLAGQTQTSTLADLLAVKADKATTLSGYGITDAYTKTEVNTKLGSYVTTTALNTALAKKVDVAFLAKVFGFIGEDSSEVSINDMGSVITSIKAKFGLWTDEYLSSKGLNPNAGGGSGEGATALYQLNDVSQNASGTGVLGAETGKVLTYGSDGKWYAAKAGMDEDALSSYLTENNYAQKSDIPSLNGYATQSWVNTALEKKVDKVSGMGLSHNDFTDTLLQKLNGIAEGANKYILPIAKAAVLGGVMIGSTLTASATGVLDLPEVAVAGTYAKVTTDVYGRVTAGYSLSASDIPALGISKITGLQAALDNKVNKADFVTEFDKAMQRWFVRDTANKGLHPADYDSEAVGIYSDSYMSAKGVNTGAGGSAGGASSLGELNNVGSWADDIPTVDRIMVQRKGATHWESLNLNDIGLNETQLSDYLTTNNYAKKSDIPSLSGYATQAWVNTKLADYATTSSVTTLLAEKVDKVEGKGLSANDFTDTLLNKLNGIEAGANKYVLPTASGSVLGGVKVGTTLAISSGVLNLKAVGTAGTYFKTTTDAYGRVTAGSNPTTLAGFGITDGVNDVAYSGSGNAVTSATVSGHIITLVKGTTFLTKATFDDLFEKVNIGTASAPVYAIKAKYGLYTEQFLSSMGLNLGTGSGGGSDYDRLDTWADYDASKAGWILSAGLGNDLNTRVTSLENGAAVTVTPSGSGTVVKDVTKNGTVITVTKGDLAFGSLTGKPTTIAGYGITNAYTKTESDGKYPLKAGTGATGTWSIDVTGYSKKLSTNQDNAVANTLMQGSGLYYNQVSSTTDTGYPSNYGQTIRWQRSTSSTLSASQAVVDLFHATGASALNKLYLRTGYGDGSKMVWGDFVQLLHTGNYTSLITKLGTTTIGSNTKFFYLNAGTPTASTATVGSSSLPVYMNAGTITQCSTTLGVSITGTAPRLTTTELTNQDLNSYTYTNYSGKLYYAGGSNTTQNVPSGISAYGLMVLRSAAGYTTQLMVSSGGKWYSRNAEGTTWSDWKQLAHITDNVASATKLQTARTINGTSFDGTANITTANWGTARNLTIGGAVKSVNGSANVSFSLNEINAAYGRNVTYTGTTTAQGWYRLASTGVGINPTNSLFFISVTVSGQHSTFLLQVSTNYGNNPSIIQLGGSNYSTASIDQFRLVYHTTYSGHYGYLEVRSRAAMTSATFNVFLVGRANTTWTLSTALTAGSIPEGYTSKTLTPASASIVAPTFRGALVGNVTGNVTGNLTGNASTATSLQTARTLWGQSFNGTANITGTLLGVESVIARSGRINNFLGYLDNSGNPATGTICITLPNGWTSSMNTYEIWIYEYNTTANASVITIGGYNYTGGGTASNAGWINVGYHTKGSYSKGVRLAYNGSKCVILLGTTTTTWSYPKVYLKTVYTGHSSQTIWGGTSTISLITSETGYTNIVSAGRMDEFFGDTSVTGRLAVTGAGHFGYTYTSMTAGINVKGDSATTGISIYDGTGTTARLYRINDVLRITRGGDNAKGLCMDGNGNIYPGANNTLANGTTTNRWANTFTQLLNVGGAATFASHIAVSGEVRSTSAKAFRAVYGSYGFFIYNDGNSTYFMLTAKDDQYGTYNTLRPLYINNSTGAVTMSNGTNIGGILNVTNTTDATTTTAAAIKTAGGLAVAKQLRVGGAATLSSSLYVTGSATFMGGIRIGDYWLRSTADGLELSHATSGKTAGLYTTGFLSSMGLNPGTGEGGSGSDYDRLDAWDDYSADKAGYVLSAKLGNDLNTRVKSLEGGSALTVKTSGSGNAVTSVDKAGTLITVTKGSTFVTTNTAQTISVEKIWTVSQKMNNTSIKRVNSLTSSNATGGLWYTADYAAIQFGIGVYTDKNASPRAFIGWTSEPWTTSNNLTVSETQLTYKAKNILHAGNYNDYAPTKTGGGASGSWGISITGNAATASKWATARTLTLTGANTGSVSIDGSANISLASTGQYLTGFYISGGNEKPTYANFGSGKLRLQMLSGNNLGLTSGWYDVLYMSSYTGGDVKQSHALVLGKNVNGRELYIFNQNYDSATWDSSPARVVTNLNYTSIISKVGTDTVGSSAKPIYLSGGTPTALSATVGSTTVPVYMNAGAITVCSTTLGVSITGNAKTASTLQNTRSIFGKAFSGAGDVVGQALVYGTYTATASSRYSNGGIQVRENGMVGNAQTDDGYAPAIGFHWGNRIGASLILTTSGFKFMNQAFTGYQNVYGIFKGNADSATQVYNTETNPTSGTWYNGTFVTSSTNGNKAIRSNDGFKYYTLEGTASAQGEAMLQLGTPTATGTAGNKRGRLVLYSSSSGYGIFVMTTTTGAYTFTFPAATGTVALTSSNVASATNADMVDNLHSSAFARADQSAAVDLNTVNGKGIMANALNDNATAERHYPMQEAGTLFYGTAAYSSANQIYGTYSTNRWFARGGGSSTTTKTAWKEFAFTTSNVASATKLQTARTLWGQSFNGTANVSGSLTGVGNITSSDVLNIITPAGKALQLKYGGAEISSLVLTDAHFKPFDAATNRLNLGTTSGRWLGVYANTGNFSSTVTGTRFISTVATGTAPLTVSSTTMVTNLNAQMVGGIGVSNIPLEYDASYIPTGTAARWIRIAYFDYSSANYSWSGTFAITNNYSNNENKGLIFTVSTAHGTTSPVITQIGGASGVFTSIRIVKDTTTAYPTTAKVYLEVYYNTTSANNRVYVSYIPANRSIGKWTLYTTYTGGGIPTGHTAIAQLYTTSGLSTTANLRVQGVAEILGSTNHNNRLNIQSDGKIVPYSTATRRSGVYGVYDSTKIGHIWSMGSAYQIADDGANFGNLYGFAYKHTTNTTGGTMASGHQAVWCENGVPKVAIGSNLWVANNATISAVLYTDTLTIKNTEAVAHLKFSRGSYNYITAPASGNITFVVGGQAVGSATAELTIQNGSLIPGTTNATSLGSSSLRWSNTYTQLLNVAGVATLSSTVNIAGVLNANNATDATSTTAAGAVFDGGVGIAKQLRVGGNVTIAGNVNFANSGQLSVPYTGGQWISMATRTNLIVGKENTSEASAHALYRVKSFAGDAVVFGGLKNSIGFYGFYKARIDSGDNGSDWATTWNTTTGALTHNKAMTVSGAVTFSSTLTVASTATFSSTTDATSTTAAAVKVTGGLGVAKQLRVGGAVTLSSTLAVTSTSTFTGKTTHNGGIGATTGTFSSTLSAAGVVSFTNATDATSTTAAAVKITGGLGIAKQLRVGGASTFSGTINTSVATFIKLGANATDQRILKDVDGNGFYSGISFFGTKGSNMGVSDIMMNIYAGGAIQIHSQAGSGQILLNGTVHNNVGMYSDGYMSSKGLNDTSDMRLKNKGRDIFLSVKDIAHAPAFEYTWKDGTPGEMVGSSAQYWQKVLPPSVKKNKDGYLSLFSGHLAMVGMISLARHHEDLERMVKGLKKEIKEKDKRIEELEKIVRQLFVA